MLRNILVLQDIKIILIKILLKKAKDLDYITKEEYTQVERLVNEIGKMLSSLRAKRNPSL